MHLVCKQYIVISGGQWFSSQKIPSNLYAYATIKLVIILFWKMKILKIIVPGIKQIPYKFQKLFAFETCKLILLFWKTNILK